MKKILFALSLLISFSAFAENQIDLTTQVKGVLPVANGGVNSYFKPTSDPVINGTVAYTGLRGLTLRAITGSAYDFDLMSASNTDILFVPTGTSNLFAGGNLTVAGTIIGAGTGLTGTAASLSVGGSAASQAITYTSSVTPLPAAGGAYTASHSLGVVPASARLEITCITAEGGYSVGDVVQTWALWNGSVFIAAPLWKSATQVGIPIGAGGELYVSNKSTAVGFTPTPANWSYRFALRKY